VSPCPTGAISFWNAEERKLEEDSKIHRNTISTMCWTPSGDRLITGDENGRVSGPRALTTQPIPTSCLHASSVHELLCRAGGHR
jgi:WD40 repeat protein